MRSLTRGALGRTDEITCGESRLSDLPPPIELTFKFDQCDTDEEIKEKIEELQKRALTHKSRLPASLNLKFGRNIKAILQNAERSLEVLIRKRASSGNTYLEVAYELHLGKESNKNPYDSAEKAAIRLHAHGEGLMQAAQDGFPAFLKKIKETIRNK